jgi:hypothetical protein
MARPIYPHELSDPDFQWLINSYKESRPGLALVDSTCLPLVIVKLEEEVEETEIDPPSLATVPMTSDQSPVIGHGKKEL